VTQGGLKPSREDQPGEPAAEEAKRHAASTQVAMAPYTEDDTK
jgi:hypothetical protein